MGQSEQETVEQLKARIAELEAKLATAENRLDYQKEVDSGNLILGNIIEQFPALVIVRDWDTQQIVHINRYVESLGYSYDEFLVDGRARTAALVHPDDLLALTDFLEDVVLPNPNRHHSHLYRIMKSDGSWLHHLIYSVLLEHKNEAGQRRRWLFSYSLDVHESRELSQILSTVTDSFPLAFSVMDLRSGTVKMSSGGSMTLLLGYPRIDTSDGEARSQRYRDAASLVHPDDKERFSEFRRRRLAEPEQSQWEEVIRFRHANGSWRHHKLMARVISRDTSGEATDWILAVLDVTTEVEIAESLIEVNRSLSEASRMKSEFLANMSHELRTPLNAVLGFAEALRMGVYSEINSEQNETLMAIDKGGRHLLTLLTDILDMARVEAGKLRIVLEPVDIEVLCLDCIQYVRNQIRQKQQRIQTSFDPEVGVARVDETRMRQVIINLLTNANKFTPEGGTLSLSLIARPEQNNFIIEVRDSGIGISAEQQAIIFDSFRQADGGLARSNDGAGLGLALASQFAALHGGKLEVESELGQGSAFRAHIPWLKVDPGDLTRDDESLY